MQALDHRIVAWMSGLDLPLVTPVMKLASTIGGSGLVFVGIGLWVALRRHRVAVGVAVVAAVVASEIASGALKRVFDRPRPSVTYADVHPLIPVPASASMPSGHAWTAFAAATVLCVVLPNRRTWLLALATLIAVSRVYLGVHYPSDVVAGAAGGVVTGGLVVLCARLVHAQIGPDQDGDGRQQRHPDAPGGADRGVADPGNVERVGSARLRDDLEQHE